MDDKKYLPSIDLHISPRKATGIRSLPDSELFRIFSSPSPPSNHINRWFGPLPPHLIPQPVCKVFLLWQSIFIFFVVYVLKFISSFLSLLWTHSHLYFRISLIPFDFIVKNAKISNYVSNVLCLEKRMMSTRSPTPILWMKISSIFIYRRRFHFLERLHCWKKVGQH